MPTTADHPTDAALAAFRRGQGIPPGEVPALIQHLAGCSACRAKQNRRPTPDELDAAWDRAIARISPEDIARRSARAQSDLPQLLAKLGVEEPFLIDPAQVSTALVTELLQEAWKLRFSDSPRCLLVCELAVRVADQLTQPAVSRRLAASACLRAHSALANAHRLRGDYAAAHASLARARACLAESLGDPADRAQLHTGEACLAFSQGRYREAIPLFARARAFAAAAADLELELGNALSIAVCQTSAGMPERSLPIFRAVAAVAADPVNARRLSPSFRPFFVHNYAHVLRDAGRLDEALGLLENAADVYGPGAAFHSRGFWLRGKILSDQGRHGEALAQLERALAASPATAPLTEQAHMNLDLAVSALALGDVARVEQLVFGLYALFQASGVETDALAALKLLHDAVGTRTLTLAMLRAAAGHFAEASP